MPRMSVNLAFSAWCEVAQLTILHRFQQNAHNDAAGNQHALVDMSTIELKAEDLVC